MFQISLLSRSFLIGNCHLAVLGADIAEEQGTQHEPVLLRNTVSLIALEQILHKYSKRFGDIGHYKISGCSKWISISSFAAC